MDPQPLTSAEKAVVIGALEEHMRLLKQLRREQLTDDETHDQAMLRTRHALELVQR